MEIKININNSNTSKKSEISPPKANPKALKIINTVQKSENIRTLQENKRKKNIQKNEIENKRDLFRELDDLIGLKNVKKVIHEIYAYVEIQKRREKENLKTDPIVLHTVFKGNPGTGKTTVARILGQLFKELEILNKGHIIEVERADLVGEYIGHTALKTKEQVKKALGGILFIDEAYSLSRGGEKDFGREAIDVLVKAMEDHRNNFILILAGYKDEMDYFIRSNPGLKSRIPITIEFPDYSLKELIDIAKLMLNNREYSLDPEAMDELRNILQKNISMDRNKLGNARLVRNIIEKSIRMQATRLLKNKDFTKEDLITIKYQDLYDADMEKEYATGRVYVDY